MALTIGVALENLGVSYFEFWPKIKMEVLYCHRLFSAKLFVLCLFHECVNTRSWRALFVRFWFIYVKVAVCYLFFVSFCSTYFFFWNQTVWKHWCIISVSLKITCNLGCEMCTISEYMYTYYYTCTYKRKVYTVWTVNDILGRIRIHIPWIDIDIYLFGYSTLKNR